jgi:hypothetical protein
VVDWQVNLVALRHCARVLARIRLTRTAAERGPVLSGEGGQMGVFHRTWCSRAFCRRLDDSTHFTARNREIGDRGERHLFIATGQLYWGAQSPSQYSGVSPIQLGA